MTGPRSIGAVRRAAHQHHRSVQFPLRLLHAEEGVRWLPKEEHSDLRRNRRRGPGGDRDPRHPPVQADRRRADRPPRAGRSRAHAPRGSAGIEDLSLTTNGSGWRSWPSRCARRGSTASRSASIRCSRTDSAASPAPAICRRAARARLARRRGLRFAEDQLRDDARHQRRRVCAISPGCRWAGG